MSARSGPAPSRRCGFLLRTLVLPVMALLAVSATGVCAQEAAGAAPPAPCMESEEARAFDFWLGSWDVYTGDGEKAGENVIQSILGGCVLLESWTGAGGSSGQSMNFWDPNRGTWRQVWVSDRGQVLDYRHGEYRDGAMRFRGITVGESGDTTLQRLTFHPIAPDTVRQVFEASRDGGATWEQTWVGTYVRRER